MLVQCAWAAIRSKKGYLHGQFLRLRARCGAKKAICAVAASILTAAYHMLKDGTFYQDLGAAHFDRRRPEAHARRLVKRLAELGFCIELKPVAATA
jgi:transposase